MGRYNFKIENFISDKAIYYNGKLYLKESYINISLDAGSDGDGTEGSRKFDQKGGYVEVGGVKWFDYDILSINISASLLDKEQIIKEIGQSNSLYDSSTNFLFQDELSLLYIALEDFETHKVRFKMFNINKSKLDALCKSYAVLDLLLRFNHLKVFEVYNLYRAISNEEFSFKTENEDYFYAKFRDAKEFGLVNALTHKGISNENATKVTKIHEEIVRHFYRDGNKTSQRQILPKINIALKLKDLDTISLSTLNRILANVYNRNLDDMVRNGTTWIKNTILPFLIRKEPEYPGDHYQIDATRLQIYCKEKGREGSFLWIAVVIDGFSKQIMGFSIDDKETPSLYVRALKHAFQRNGCLPAEILRDNYKGYTTNPELVDLIKTTENLGVIWRAHQVGNPRDKGIVESFNNVFNNTICRNVIGFVGEGIKSRNINARPNPEILYILKKGKMLYNRDQLIKVVTERVHYYNQKKENKPESPLEKYRTKKEKNIIRFTSKNEPLIFYKKKILKMMRSTICLTVNGYAHFYQLNNLELMLKLNNANIQVRYNPIDLDTIYVYNELGTEYYTNLSRKEPVPLAKINQTSIDVTNMQSYFDENKKIYNQLLVMIEERKSAIEALGLPEEILDINYTEKVEFIPTLNDDSKCYLESIELPSDLELRRDPIFKKHSSVYSEVEDLLFKKKGSSKRLSSYGF